MKTTIVHRQALYIPVESYATLPRLASNPATPTEQQVARQLKDIQTGTTTTATPPLPKELRELVNQFAPILISKKSCPYNIPQAVNFDGDWDVSNNVTNYKPGQPHDAQVYFHVVSSKTHAFIDYYLYYPVDGGALCVSPLGHPNDASSVRLIVRKAHDGKPAMLEKLITSDHSKVRVYGAQEIKLQGQRVAIEITTGTHAMTPLAPSDDLPSDKHNFLFNQTETSTLIPIQETLWQQRNNASVFQASGQFQGKRAPWSPWSRNFSLPQSSPESRSVSGFFDPIAAYQPLYTPETFSTEYEYNPYIPNSK